MTAHKRKEWYIVAKNKRLTNKEKQARAEFKKRMQDKGVLPLDKPKLNRKKFIDEARKEWNGRSSDCFIWEGVYKMKVKEETETTYKFDSKFEKAMKAIFTGDYTFETTLEEFLDEMSIKPDDKQKKLLLKKLKGEFEKDKETLISVLVPEGETVPDFDVELWYIYRIKNGELIKAFLPEEMIDATIEGIRKSILVETKTSITLDYDETEKEE